MNSSSKLYAFTMKTVEGELRSLGEYEGKVLMIVNTASKCGFTPQYESLQSIYEKYKDRGFMILAFPANNFLWQEPGSDPEIRKFCEGTYHVTFDLFSKINVRGWNQHPLYKYLTTETDVAGKVKWNFQKYLADRKGRVVAKFSPGTKPNAREVVDMIEKLIGELKGS
jgi:glutathione peroxidase